jgi:hypothetical protein
VAKRSEKSSYQSRYSPGEWVTPAQYIIEYVCENAAQYSGKDLPLRFWKNEEWQKFFVSQTRAANRLLKKYKSRSIISAIKKKRLRSLLPKWVEGVIQKEENELNVLLAKKAIAEKEKPKRKDRKRIINKPGRSLQSGSMSKLLALDEEIDVDG